MLALLNRENAVIEYKQQSAFSQFLKKDLKEISIYDLKSMYR